MTDSPPLLPPEFQDLEPFASSWAGRSSDDRHHQRQIASIEQIRAFHDAMAPRLDQVFDYLDRLDLSALPPPARVLLQLSFGFAEAAASVEIFGAPGLGDTPYPHGISVIRELPGTSRP